MAFVKKTWQARISEYPNRRTITDENGVTKPVTVGRAEGTVTQEGDGFTSENMNDLEQRVYDAFQSLTLEELADVNISSPTNGQVLKYNGRWINGTGGGGGSSWIDLTGTLYTGQTSITFLDNEIGTDSTIDIYTADGTSYNSVSVSEGSVTITFDVQASDLGVKVRVS